MKWLKCLCGFHSSWRSAKRRMKLRCEKKEASRKIQSRLWTILLSVFEHHWRRKYLWNQLIPHPNSTAVPVSKFIHHQRFTSTSLFAFCLRLFFVDDQQKLSKWTTSHCERTTGESRENWKSDTFNAFPFVSSLPHLNIEIYGAWAWMLCDLFALEIENRKRFSRNRWWFNSTMKVVFHDS